MSRAPAELDPTDPSRIPGCSHRERFVANHAKRPIPEDDAELRTHPQPRRRPAARRARPETAPKRRRDVRSLAANDDTFR